MQTPTPAPVSGWEQFNGASVPIAIGCVFAAWLIVALINTARR